MSGQQEWSDAAVYRWLRSHKTGTQPARIGDAPGIGVLVARRARTAINPQAAVLHFGRLAIKLEQALRRVWINVTEDDTYYDTDRANTTMNQEGRLRRWMNSAKATVKRRSALSRIVLAPPSLAATHGAKVARAVNGKPIWMRGHVSMTRQLQDREVGQFRKRARDTFDTRGISFEHFFS